MRKTILITTLLLTIAVTANAAKFFFEVDDYGTVITTEDVQMTSTQVEQIVNYGYELDDFKLHKAYFVECEDEFGEYKYVAVLSDEEEKFVKKCKKVKGL